MHPWRTALNGDDSIPLSQPLGLCSPPGHHARAPRRACHISRVQLLQPSPAPLFASQHHHTLFGYAGLPEMLVYIAANSPVSTGCGTGVLGFWLSSSSRAATTPPCSMHRLASSSLCIS